MRLFHRISLLAIFCLLIASCTNKPKEQQIIVSPGQSDFGVVKAGTVIKTSFLITNETNADLALINVSSSCGCTTADWHPQTLKPHKSLSIGVVLTTYGYKGKRKSAIALEFQSHPLIQIPMEMYVQSPVFTDPDELNFTLQRDETKVLFYFYLDKRLAEDDSGLGVKLNDNRLSVKTTKSVVSTDSKFKRIKIEAECTIPPDLSTYYDTISVTDNGIMDQSFHISFQRIPPIELVNSIATTHINNGASMAVFAVRSVERPTNLSLKINLKALNCTIDRVGADLYVIDVPVAKADFNDDVVIEAKVLNRLFTWNAKIVKL
jgi:hypothetical protein